MINIKRSLIIVLICLSAGGYLAAQNEPPCLKTVMLTPGDLGSLENPVKCDGADGEIRYLKKLRDESGQPVFFKRIDHAHPDMNGHILDKYAIKTSDGSLCADIFMDMHCPGYTEKNAVLGLFMEGQPNPDSTAKRKPMTARDVYRMIARNGFYCEIVKGSRFHDEGLKSITRPTNGVFPFKRMLMADSVNKNLVETWSKARFKNARSGKNIKRLWYRKGKRGSFEGAAKYIEKINKRKLGKRSDWRLPTIYEMFSIIESGGSHFPSEFLLPEKKTLIFWTATPLKKKGTVLDHSKDKPAYLVIRRQYDKKNQTYSVHFSFNNTSSSNAKAYFIPVCFEKPLEKEPVKVKVVTPPPAAPNNSANQKSGSQNKTGKTAPQVITPPNKSQSQQTKDKIPGFDDNLGPTANTKLNKNPNPKGLNNNKKNPTIKYPLNSLTQGGNTQKPKKKKNLQGFSIDRIPGFDDVNVKQNSYKQKSYTNTPASQKISLKVALIPYLSGKKQDSGTRKFLNAINVRLEDELKQVKHVSNVPLVIERYDLSNFKHYGTMKRFQTIISNPQLTESKKLEQVRNDLMIPSNTHIIVSIETSELQQTRNKPYRILNARFISLLDNKIHTHQFKIDPNTKPFDGLGKYFKNRIKNVR